MDGRFAIGTTAGLPPDTILQGFVICISRPGKTQHVIRGQHAARDSIVLPAKSCEMRIGFK